MLRFDTKPNKWALEELYEFGVLYTVLFNLGSRIGRLNLKNKSKRDHTFIASRSKFFEHMSTFVNLVHTKPIPIFVHTASNAWAAQHS